MVNVVPHTHWDREWYQPLPVFRMQLVDLLDGLLPTLEAGDGYDHFQLDGQMAAVDDFLEIRPHERDRLIELNGSGRLSMGPWYTLPDEFLVSGETLVRNLALGFEKAEEFGGAMAVGYLPDMFGHVAQMPQILAGFGLHDAVVWRGIPAAITAPAFRWRAPDGTSVRAEYLSDGYSNGARLPRSGEGLVDQVAAFCENQGDLVGDPVLWMNGTDHLLPQPWLARVIREANDAQDRFRFVVTSLTAHLDGARPDDLPTWSGELRSGARTNVLMGVASCRVDVKQAAARGERELERIAEPLGALWLPSDAWPGAFLDMAWLEMIRNAAHDSICGCSADEVNDAVLHRYAEATRVAEGVTERALIRVLAASGQDAIAVNPSSRTRSATVSAVVPGEVVPPHAQQISVRPQVLRSAPLSTASAVPVVIRAALEDPRVSAVSVEPVEHHPGEWLARVVADRRQSTIDPVALRRRLEALAEDHPDDVVHLEVQRPSATQEVLLRTTVDGFGWRGLAPEDLGSTAVRPHGQGLTNGRVTVEADQTDGTFSMVDAAGRRVSGLGRLVDDGDAGDTYNWSPPEGDLVVERPDDVDVTVTEAGPVRGRIEIERTYTWPEQVANDHRVGEVEVKVTTIVELHAGEDVVRLSVAFDNAARDHRLRLHLPLPEPAEESVAECAFTTVTRGLEAEGGPNEAALPTFPSRRFVSAGGLLVAHDGLTEYELVGLDDRDGATEMAITLIRSVGIISQGPMRMRALPAGPPTPTPGAQMPGPHTAQLVLHLGERDPYAVTDEAFTPMLTARLPGGRGLGDPATSGWGLAVSGAEVSALRWRDDGRRELRVFNPSDQGTTLTVTTGDGPVRGEVTDLRGRATGTAFDGSIELGPHRILTLALNA